MINVIDFFHYMLHILTESPFPYKPIFDNSLVKSEIKIAVSYALDTSTPMPYTNPSIKL